MDTVKVVFDLPVAFIERLDALVEARRGEEPRVLSPEEWLLQTMEGRTWWAKNHHRTSLSTQEMRSEIRSAWEVHTGGKKNGRPPIRHHRASILAEALALLDGKGPIDAEA